MRTTIFAALLGLGLLLATPPAVAHHAFSAEFDADRPMQLHGTVSPRPTPLTTASLSDARSVLLTWARVL